MKTAFTVSAIAALTSTVSAYGYPDSRSAMLHHMQPELNVELA